MATTFDNAKIQQAGVSAKRRNEIALRIHNIDSSISNMMTERKSLIKERNIIDNQDYAMMTFPMFPDYDNLETVTFPNQLKH